MHTLCVHLCTFMYKCTNVCFSPSRFDKLEKPDVAQLTAAQLRVKQRQQKVNERISTSTPGERPDIDVFKNIFSDTESESEDENDKSRNVFMFFFV